MVKTESGNYVVNEDMDMNNSVRMYLNEIGKYSLLTLEQENELTRRKQRAQNLLKKKKLGKLQHLSKVTLSKLNAEELKIVKAGEASMKRLIECNLRLVVYEAKKYRGYGLMFQDLIQEGTLGLVRGIEKYDCSIGTKVSTYATLWIKQAIRRALDDQGRTIRLPVHVIEAINKMNKVSRHLAAKNGCEPTISEIAKEMKLSIEKVEELMQSSLEPLSLEQPVGLEKEAIIADYVPDDKYISPEKNAYQMMIKDQVRKSLSTLKERERKVIELRWGIGDDTERTLEEVGRMMNVTRERIRQIEAKALKKLAVKLKNVF